MSYLKAQMGVLLRREQRLPSYRPDRSLLEKIVGRTILISLSIFIGLFYGFSVAILPPALVIYLGIPAAILLLLDIWVLPETVSGPVKALTRLFYIYAGVLILWPNYLAIELAGLPWISIRRLIAISLTLIFLITLSVSPNFRNQLADRLGAAKPLTSMILYFTLVQFLTIFISADPFHSLNIILNYIPLITIMYFAGAWVLAKSKAAEKFSNLLIFISIIIVIIGFFEKRNGQILWANHIPSFLQIEDQSVLQTLTAMVRDNKYRVTTTFSVSLCMAEFLAMVSPFVAHKIFENRDIRWITFWIAIDLALLASIVSTQSRLGIVSYLTAHAAYIGLWSFRRWRRTKADILGPALALLYPVAASLFFVGMFTVDAIRVRTIGGGSSGLSDVGRSVQFHMMWPKLLKNPFGYGAGRGGSTLGYITPSGKISVDSYIITMMMDYGIIGFLLFFGALLYAIVKMAQVAWNSRSTDLDLALPLSCSLLVVLQVRWVLSQVDNLPLIYMLLGMTAAMLWRERQHLGVPNRSAAPETVPPKIEQLASAA